MSDDKTALLTLLICFVRDHENLWNKSNMFYKDEQLEQASWDSISRKMNCIFENTDKITAENLQYTWKNLLEANEEWKKHLTATIFPLSVDMQFLEESKYPTRAGLDGFSRKNGKFLVWLQLILNIIFIVCVFCSMPSSADGNLCSNEFILPLCSSVFAGFVLLWYHFGEAESNDQNELFYWPFLGVAVLGPILIGYSFFLSYTADECTNPVVTFNLKSLSILTFLSMYAAVGQIITIGIHAIKLDHPPAMNNSSTVLITEFMLGTLFTVSLMTSQWTEFYAALSGWIWINFFILLSYYVRCHKNAKTLYRFQKRSRLVAIGSKENPYNIRFEREE